MVDGAAVNVAEQVSVDYDVESCGCVPDVESCGCVPGSGTAGSLEDLFLAFLIIFHTGFHSGCFNLKSNQQ